MATEPAPTHEGPEQEGPRRHGLFRGPERWRRVLALPSLAAAVGVLFFVLAYHWPRPNAWLCFFTMLPAFVWFALLLPPLLLGAVAVRTKWLLCGCLLWAVGLVATEEVLPVLRLGGGRARSRFEAARGWFLSSGTPASTSRGGEGIPLRAATWNVALGRMDAEQAVRQLTRLEPDIVFLQEFSGENLADPIQSSPLLADYHFARAGRTVLLSRFPIEELPGDAARPAPATAYGVELGAGTRITCISADLYHHILEPKPRFRSWRKERVAAGIIRTADDLDRLAEMVRRHAAHSTVILAGDFNLPAHYPALPAATPGLKDAFSANGYGWGKTMPARLALLRIDLIFVSDDVEVFRAGAVPTAFSDHRIVVADVSVPVGRRSATP